MKRIHKVVIKRMQDECPDTSWLGDYSDKQASEFSIDRAHDLDCLCQPYNRITGEGERILESAQQYLCDRMNETESDEDLRVWYDDGDSFVSAVLAGDAEEFCLGPCMSRWDSREYRYFNGPIENYKGELPEDIRKYVRQDFERMESLYRGDFCFIGIRAEAEWSITQTEYARNGSLIQTVTSGGLWVIESDSSSEYLKEIEQEQLAELRSQLKAIGFSSRAISAAFRNVETEVR